MSISYLSDNTRKTRRSLLAASLIAYAISELGLTLTEVQVFGSKFEFQNYGAIPFVLILVILYFLVTFAVYSLSEYSHGYKIAGEELMVRHKQGKSTTPQEIIFISHELERTIQKLRDRRYVPDSRHDATMLDKLDMEIEQKLSERHKLQSQYDIAKKIQHRTPIFARITWKSFRTFVEIALPFIISLYAIGHLAFFTEITNPSPNGDVETANMTQPDSMEVVTEVPVTVDPSDTASGG